MTFDTKVGEELLSYLNRFDWAFKYAVVTWLSSSLMDPKRQVFTANLNHSCGLL